MVRLLPALLFLAACGPPPLSVPCMGPVTADGEFDPVVAESKARCAARLIGDLEGDGVDYCAVFEKVPVRVRAELSWVHNGETVTGVYWRGARAMDLGADLRAYLHEALHHLDNLRGLDPEMVHLGWEERGYSSLALGFEMPSSGICALSTGSN